VQITVRDGENGGSSPPIADSALVVTMPSASGVTCRLSCSVRPATATAWP